MAGRIPREFIDDLIARVDLVNLIDSRVRLKKAGKNYSACCPFHNEKTPSFTVSREKQFYHCFGCGAHGNALDFLMNYERLDFVDAIEELAGQMGLEVPREQSSGATAVTSSADRQLRKEGHHLMEAIARFYQAQLRQHPDHPSVIAYLKQRGLDGATAKKWELGYAPPEWDALLKVFGQSEEARQQLVQLGMLTRNDNGKLYDRFRGRLMFTIRDKRGKVCGFGGRVMATDSGPKYLNSPETPLFHKGLELYGLHQLKQAHPEPQQVIVVEGYMDVVALSQHGVDNAIASLGTSTTREQLQLLSRLTDTIIFCYDGDNAGRDAAWRALENAMPIMRDGLQLRFAFLPDGEDPDSLVKRGGAEAFHAELAKAQGLTDFFFGALWRQVDGTSAEGRTKLVQLAQPLLDQMPECAMRTLMRDQLASRVGLSPQQLPRVASGNKPVAPKSTGHKRLTPVRTAITLLIQAPQLARLPAVTALAATGAFRALQLAGAELLQQLLDHACQQPLTTGSLLEQFRDGPHHKPLATLAAQPLPGSDEELQQVLIDTLEKLLTFYLEQRQEALLAKARQGSLNDHEKAELSALLEETKRRAAR